MTCTVNFKFKLANTGKKFDGSWKKTAHQGLTGWQSGRKFLFNSSFFSYKNKVFEAIEREGWPLRQLYFPDMRRKIAPPLTKETIKTLYYREKKSLQEIAKGYGCTRQMVMAYMDKYGLRRRTLLKARILAIRKGKYKKVSR